MKKNRIDEFLANPRKALWILSFPIMVSTTVQTLYSIVDTAFVGRLGSNALAAISFAFPLFFILISLNSGIGVGMSSRIARFMGEKKKSEAENTALHGFLLAGLAYFGVIFVGGFFLEEIFVLFGAEGNVLSLAVDYMSIVIFGSILMFVSFLFSSFFSSQGDTKTPMKVSVSSLVLNVILDPIFIFGFGWGIKGAAAATVVAFGFAIVLNLYYLKKKSYLELSFRSFKWDPNLVKEIVNVGVPASLMMVMMSIYVIFLNKVMVSFSSEHVAAFGVSVRLESMALMPLVGMAFGLMNLVGMFFGARRFDVLDNISWYAIRVALIISSLFGFVIFLFPEFFLRIFTDDATLIAIGVPYMRIDAFTFPLMAISMLVSRIMQGLGYGFPSLMINLVRIFFVAIPLAYIFVFVLGHGYLSVAYAMVAGGLASTLFGLFWLRKHLHMTRADN